MDLETKQFEIFSGTGGVGKTTLATSRAISLAQQKKRVLLITIDPSKRLKDLFQLSHEGIAVKVPDPFNQNEELDLQVQIMNPQNTFSKMAELAQCTEVLDNRILKILTKPYGGLNEILALVELNLQLKTNNFDVIVLDTPPGNHFLDFLDSTKRIRVFFDKSFIEIFHYLGKKVEYENNSFGKKIFTKFVAGGVKKLLSYLNKVTGDKFVDEFIDAIIAFYKTKNIFLDALTLQQSIMNTNESNWFLVTSVEQNKIQEALDLKNNSKGMITDKTIILINKCIESDLLTWMPIKDSANDQLKKVLLQRELKLKEAFNKTFSSVINFPEIYNVSPIEHLKELTNSWNHTRSINGQI